MFETPIDPASVTLSPATLNLSSNNSTSFFPLQEVVSRGLAPCAATISSNKGEVNCSGIYYWWDKA
jgi:hypothetical protein